MHGTNIEMDVHEFVSPEQFHKLECVEQELFLRLRHLEDEKKKILEKIELAFGHKELPSPSFMK